MMPFGTPSVMELSGRDPAIVLPGANPDAVARAIAYGLSLNGGETCIAPRRVLAVGGMARAVAGMLPAALAAMPERPVSDALAPRLRAAIDLARALGGTVIGNAAGLAAGRTRPLVLQERRPGDLSEIAGVFGPVATLAEVADEAAAIAAANAGAHALGASVFGSPAAARRRAEALLAGCVTINDLIAPTADPRLPFGGAGASGHGTTRGAEGLLEMTRPQAIIGRRRTATRHCRALPERRTRAVAWMLRALYRLC
jgi:acyl-CoA reductase-like NAD-dependent aldehyde dehydrogenase